MKSFSRISTLAIILCLTLAGVTASAKVKSRTVAVSQEFTVGATVIKPGIYLFRFDDKTNELTIADNARRKEIIARVSARAEERPEAASTTDLQLAKQGDTLVLTGLTFSGEKWNISVGQQAASVKN